MSKPLSCFLLRARVRRCPCRARSAKRSRTASAPAAVAAAPHVARPGSAKRSASASTTLRYDKQHDVRGAHIILGRRGCALLRDAAVRSRPGRIRRGSTRWSRRIVDLANDGLDPADYHLEALQSYRLDLRMKTPLTGEDRADLELLATDALMLALYHVYGGKVDPVKLSSQWNYASRPSMSIARSAFLEHDARQRTDPRSVRPGAPAARLVPARARMPAGVSCASPRRAAGRHYRTAPC